MGDVHADPAAIRKFQRSLQGFNRELETLVSRLKSQLRTLETNWPDAEGRKFAVEMQNLINAMDRYRSVTPELLSYLDQKATPLERYKGQGR